MRSSNATGKLGFEAPQQVLCQHRFANRIADRATVAAGELDLQPELERFLANLTALTALVKPWVAPPATSKEKSDGRPRSRARSSSPGPLILP